MPAELTTVGNDFAVVFDGSVVRDYRDLEADTAYEYDGVAFRTLPRPGGELLSTVATVNDVHFGETVCGLDGSNPDAGPVFRSEPGEPPYPETMNAAVVEEIVDLDPDLVVVKGDLTGSGTDEQYAQFLACYEPPFGERMIHIRGNHETYPGATFADFGPQRRDLEGVTVALIDTSRPRQKNGYVAGDDLEWLDAIGREADRPVLVMGHHHAWPPGSRNRSNDYFGIIPDDTEALIDVFVRRRHLVGYFAGHTHRHRVRRFTATGERPWVEVACVKDFPGAWAEYRVYEGGILQIAHRARRHDAVRWTDRTRGMFNGLYADYAFGSLDERCFRVC